MLHVNDFIDQQSLANADIIKICLIIPVRMPLPPLMGIIIFNVLLDLLYIYIDHKLIQSPLIMCEILKLL